MRRQNGITLVALVITVIIMLILAGVAISVLTEDGGLFRKSQNAGELYEHAADEENAMLSNLMNYVDVQLHEMNMLSNFE